MGSNETVLGRLFIALGGLVVVALFAALLLPLFVNWTDFRQDFEDQASRILGKKVTVNGAVEARLLPFPSVTLNDVTVGPGEDGQTLARVARFSMDAELAPLLSGEMRIFAMRVERPEVRLRILGDGTLDWLRGSRPSLPARTVVLEKVTVTNGAVTVIDDQTGRTRQVSDLAADLSAGSLAGPWTVAGAATLDGEAGQFSISSQPPEPGSDRIALKIRLSPQQRPVDVDLAGDLALVEGRPTLAGSFVAVLRDQPGDVTGLDGTPVPAPRVKGKFELANERVSVPDYRLEIGPASEPYVVTGKANLDAGPKGEFLLTADGQQIDVDRLVANLPKVKTGRQAAGSARQRINALLALANQIPIPAAAGRASLKLPAIVAGDTVVREIELDLRPAGSGWQVDKAVAVLPGRTRLEASGLLQLKGRPGFTGSLLAASNQPSGLAGWLSGSVDPAIRQLRTAGLAAKVTLTADLQRFEDLELAVGPASLRGRLERQAVEGGMPSLSVDLSGNAFDYDAVRALAALISGDGSNEALWSHQIAAKLKVDQFSALGVTAERVESLFSYRNGGFALRKLDIGNLAGASVKATGEASGSLVDYSGKAQVSLHADGFADFLAMLKRTLPSHPVLARLAEAGRWFNDTDLVLDARFGEGQYGGLQLDLRGKSEGSAVKVTYRRDSLFDPLDTAAATLSINLANDEPSVLFGQLGFDPLPVPIDGRGELTADLKEAGPGPAEGKVVLAAGATRMEAEGSISLSAGSFADGKGALRLTSEDIEPLLIMNAVSLPGFGEGLPLRLTASVTRADGRLTLDQLDGDLAGNAVSGTLNLEPQAGQPTLSGRLAVDRLPLDWLASTVVGPVTNAAGGLATDPIPASIWGTLAANLQVSVQRADLGALPPLTDAGFTLRLDEGAIALDTLSGRLAGGTLTGTMSLSNTSGTGFLRSDLALTDARLDGLWGDRGPRAEVSGKLKAEGSGTTVAALLSSLNGAGEARLRDLALPDLDPTAYRDLATAFETATGPIAQASVETALAPLMARADARVGDLTIPLALGDGTLRLASTTAPLEGARLQGEGQLDLAEASIDAALTLAFDPGADAIEGGLPEVRVVISGPVREPVARLETAELANFLSLRGLERERRRVETLQANVLEKQRLRREVALYTALSEARAKAEADRRAAEAAARAARSLDPSTPDRGAGGAGSDSLPAGGLNGRPLQFDSLPGLGVTPAPGN